MKHNVRMRDRMLAVIQGREHDRVPFAQYNIRSEKDPAVILGLAASNEEIWSVIGRENMGILRWGRVHRLEHPNCHFHREDIFEGGLQGRRTILHTPIGELCEERFYDPTFGSPSIKSHYVREMKDYKVLAAFLKDVIVHETIDDFLKIQKEVGEDGVVQLWAGRTPFQQLWIEWVSIEDLACHMADCPEQVEECIALMVRNLRKLFEIIRKAPIPYAVFPDNITAPIVGEKYFRQYCVPLYDELANILADRNIPVLVHMDGDLKPLWKAIGQSKIGGLESFSPPPSNDTTAKEALSMWPHMRLLLNFPSSVHLASPEQVYRTATQILEEAGHSGQLQIQISENVPPDVWRTSFPMIVKAIKDFGKI